MALIGLHGVSKNEAALKPIYILVDKLSIQSNTESVVVCDLNAETLTYPSQVLHVRTLENCSAILIVKDVFRLAGQIFRNAQSFFARRCYRKVSAVAWSLPLIFCET